MFKFQSRHFHDTPVTSRDPFNSVIAVVKKTASALAASLALSTLLVACGGGSDDTPSVPRLAASVSDNTQFFNRVATFAVCEQIGSSCEARVATAAEIVAASKDGMTLIYTNSPKDEVGFVDITDPSAPVALGALAMGGEPTSITVQGNHALIAVNTSPSFTAPDGKLVVVDIATRQVVHEIALGGQPDSIAISKDGKYVAVVIENERDEDLGDGTPPQLPGGKLVIVDTMGAPNTWQTRDVALTNLAMLYPTDPEPEYVSINDNNVAVVTLQENNHIVQVDLATGKVTRDFTAGKVSLTQIDLTDAPRPNQVNLTESLSNRLREPDGVTWVSTSQFVTANEGDLDGGSRGFTLFNTDGSVAYDAGNTMEHLMARIGHTNDKRSDAKGNEPENVAAGRFDRTDYLFVASERSSVLAVPGRWVGQLAAFPLTPGLALRENMVRAPQAFAPGAQVRVSGEGGGFSISATGKALTAGMVGETARVKLPGGRVITGVVRDAQTVELAL